MQTIAEFAVFILGWIGIMALISFICYLVSAWGKGNVNKTEPNDESEKPKNDDSSAQ